MSETNNIGIGRHHVSKTYILLFVFRGLWAVMLVVFIGIANILRESTNILETAYNVNMLPIFSLGIAVLVIAVVTLIAYLSYYRLTWEITDEEIHIYKGIIIKKKSHIPYRRIHSVDMNAKIMDRILGVVTLKLGTAAGSSMKEDAKIPALRLSTAEILKKEIFQRKSSMDNEALNESKSSGGNVFTGLNKENDRLRGIFAGSSNELSPQSEYRLTNKELFLFCLANGRAFVIILIALGLINEIINVISSVNSRLAESTEEMFKSFLSGEAPLVIFILVIIALLMSFVVSFVTRALTFGNFVAKRYSSRIETSTGLLQKRSTGVSIERIQTFKIKQSLLQRIMGYAELSIITASGFSQSNDDDQQIASGVILHPFLKISKVEDFIEKMLFEYIERPEINIGLTKLAMRRSIIRYGMFSFLFIFLPVNLIWNIIKHFDGIGNNDMQMVIGIIDPILIYLSAFLIILMIVIGWAAWKGRAYEINGKFLGMRKGIIGRTKIFVPKKKIQYGVVTQNPFQKRVRLVTIKANTAANDSSNESMKDLGIAIGEEYLDWIKNKKSTTL